MPDFKLGEKVRGTGINSGAVYEGTVVRSYCIGQGECKIRIKKVICGIGADPGTEANVIYVERIEDMINRNTNLLGPKPEPVKEPEFVTPLRADGANIVDANNKVVTRVQFGGYVQGSYRSELPVALKYELAEIFVRAVNEKYGKAEDSKSPF